MRQLVSIQYLRAVTALSVVIVHLTVRYGGETPPGLFHIDLFFILSGFILWVTTAEQPSYPSNFMTKRLVRVVPIYWLATAATALMIVIKPYFAYKAPLDLPRFIGSLLFFPTLVGGHIVPVVLQGWMMVFEIILYVCFAATLLVGRTYRPYVLITLLSAIIAFHAMVTEPHLSAVTEPRIFLEFIVGIVLALFWRRYRLPPRVAASLVVVGLIWQVLDDYLKPAWPELVSAGAPSLLILAGAVFYEKAAKLPRLAFAEFVGSASYSLFLWHVLVSFVIHMTLLRFNLVMPVQYGIELSITVALCLVLYVILERPVFDYLRNVVSRGRLQPAAVPISADAR